MTAKDERALAISSKHQSRTTGPIREMAANRSPRPKGRLPALTDPGASRASGGTRC
jgi:hypothetical protein